MNETEGRLKILVTEPWSDAGTSSARWIEQGSYFAIVVDLSIGGSAYPPGAYVSRIVVSTSDEVLYDGPVSTPPFETTESASGGCSAAISTLTFPLR